MSLLKKIFSKRKIEKGLDKSPDFISKQLSKKQCSLLKKYCDKYTKKYDAGIFFEEDYVQGLLSSRAPLFPKVITETLEPTIPKGVDSFLKIMEKIQGHVGLPSGVVQTLHSLNRHCLEEGIVGLASNDENGGYSVQVRLGKGLFNINYDSRGAYKDMSSEFMVGGPVFM